MAGGSALQIPAEVWDHIISMLHHDRHIHLRNLSLVCKYFLSITNRYNLSLKILNPTADLLPSILRRFPNLNHLSLSDFHGDVAPVLHRIADFKSPLQTLDLSGQDRLPIEALERFPASVLSCVKSLNISYLSQGVDDSDLKMIADLFPNLEELDLSRAPNRSPYDIDDDHFGAPIRAWWHDRNNNKKAATVDGFSVLASKLKGCLRMINLEGNYWVSDEVISCICRNCPNLEEIRCRMGLTMDVIAFELSTCRNMKAIGLHNISDLKWVCTRFRKPLSQALNLSNVVFSDTLVTDALLNVMAKAKLPLKSFSLIDCPLDRKAVKKVVTFGGILSFLGTYDSLHHLALLGVHFLSDASVCALVNSLTMARSVRLRHTIFGNPDFTLSDLALFSFIQQCPLLETLEISQSANITDGSGLCGITNAEIRSLDLSSNDNLSDECLEKIALACPNLERLRLSRCPKISNKGVGEILRNCQSLKHLNMNYCSMVKSLGLEDMNNDGEHHLELQFLGASKSGLDDKSLIDMAGKCPRLMSLNVDGCNGLTTQGVKQVVDKLTRLKEINLRGCLNVSNSIV